MFKVLIIEDDEIISHIYKSKLESEGYKVETAPDGITGLERFRNFQPDIMLLDMMLPELSGLRILKHIRGIKTFENFPIFVFSSTPSTLSEALECGANRALSKGEFSPNQIVALITETLSIIPQQYNMEDFTIQTLSEWENSRGKALVVDDDPIVLALVKNIVEKENYKVVTANDGKQAYKILCTNENEFAFCIFDINMPGINGVELVSLMGRSESLKEIPVLTISGDEAASVQKDSLDSGATVFIPKPFTRATLGAMIKSIVPA